nr:hypothetical protein [Tanacetum cinerariifolium]
MVAILKKGEYNIDFHPMVDFITASPLRHNLKIRDEDGIVSLPDTELFENLTLMGYNISQNQKFTFQKGKAFPTDSGFIAYQDRATITKSSSLPHDSAPRAQEVEIRKFKDRVKVLEDREGVADTQSRDDAPIKRRSIDEGEAATERISDDSEELARVLTSM